MEREIPESVKGSRRNIISTSVLIWIMGMIGVVLSGVPKPLFLIAGIALMVLAYDGYIRMKIIDEVYEGMQFAGKTLFTAMTKFVTIKTKEEEPQ